MNGPGPAYYNAEKAAKQTLRRSPSPTMGKQQKKTWAEILSRTISPGPGSLYPSTHYVSK